LFLLVEQIYSAKIKADAFYFRACDSATRNLAFVGYSKKDAEIARFKAKPPEIYKPPLHVGSDQLHCQLVTDVQSLAAFG
jgi:hypothetical protein